MAEPALSDVKTQSDVFISYSRKDIAFVRILHGMLKERGLDTWVDWQDIPPSADWMAEVYKAIESANAFVFVVSETSGTSDVCRLEVAHAVKHNKRIIPITVHDVDPKSLPSEVASRNWVFFRENDDMQASFDRLLEAVETDLEWVKAHTALLQRAIEWDEEGREPGFLLRGAALASTLSEVAEASLGREPALTSLQVEYVERSRAFEAEQARRWKRRTQIIWGVITSALVVSVVLTIWALLNAAEARRQQTLSRSNELVASSRAALPQDPSLAYLLARAAIDVKATPAAQAALWDPLQYPFSKATMVGHTGEINDVELSADGKLAVTVADDGTARVWEVTTGKQVWVLDDEAGHSLPFITSVAISPDGHSAITMTGYMNVTGGAFACLWDLESGKLVRKIDHDDFSFGCPLISPDGKLVVTHPPLKTLGEPEVLALSELETGEPVRTLEGLAEFPTIATFSPDGTLLAAGEIEGGVAMWEVATGRMIKLAGHSTTVHGLAFSPDGKQLVSTAADGTLRVQDVATGAQVRQVDFGGVEVGYAAFSPDGTKLAVKRAPDEVVVLETRGWTVLYVARKTLHEFAALYDDDVAFSPDGALLLLPAPDGSVVALDAATGGEALSLRGHVAPVTAVEFAPDGGLLTGSEDETARAWNLEAGQDIFRIQPPAAEFGGTILSVVDVSPDRKCIAVRLTDDTCELYSAETGEKLYSINDTRENDGPLTVQEQYEVQSVSDQITSVTFSPDSSRILVFTAEAAPTMRDVMTGDNVVTLDGPKSMYSRPTFSPDGATFTTTDRDNVVRLWDAESAKLLQEFKISDDAPELSSYISETSFSPDGDRLAVVFGSVVTIWDVEGGEKLATLEHGSDVGWLQWSPDGKTLFDGPLSLNSATVAWDAAAAKRLYELEGVRLAEFSADGTKMLTLDEDGVRLRESATGAEIAEFASLDKPTAATFSPDGLRIAVGYADGGIRVWDAEEARVLHVFTGHTSSVGTLVYTPDGTRLISAAYSETVRVWPTDYREMLRLMDDGFRGGVRELTAAEKAEYGFLGSERAAR